MLDLSLGRRRAYGSPNFPSKDRPMTTATVLGSNPGLSARALASRKNGAKSRGPKTAEGKARSAQNALKHGLRAEKYLVLPDEDPAELEALVAELIEELAPAGALERFLVGRIARAAWRLERAERTEVSLFAERLTLYPDAGPGLALIRDGNSTRSFETVLRYRAAANAELLRALKTLKELQAQRARGQARAEAPAPAPMRRPSLAPAAAPQLDRSERPNEPKHRENPGIWRQMSRAEVQLLDQPEGRLVTRSAAYGPGSADSGRSR
jgi:hypothetical protein